jgi:hypothetical protein
MSIADTVLEISCSTQQKLFHIEVDKTQTAAQNFMGHAIYTKAVD